MLETLQSHASLSHGENRAAQLPQSSVSGARPADGPAQADSVAASPRNTESEREDTPPNSVPASQSSSSLTTYRDHKSGRLVVRVVDKNSGEILIEFPPERSKAEFFTQSQGENTGARTSIEV